MFPNSLLLTYTCSFSLYPVLLVNNFYFVFVPFRLLRFVYYHVTNFSCYLVNLDLVHLSSFPPPLLYIPFTSLSSSLFLCVFPFSVFLCYILCNCMENLCPSLSDTIFNFQDQNLRLEYIKTIYGHSDSRSLSKYYDFDNYNLTSKHIPFSYTNIVHVNTRSIRKNCDHLKSLLHCIPNPPNVLSVTETWL